MKLKGYFLSGTAIALSFLLATSLVPAGAAAKPAAKLLKLLWSDEFAGKKGALPNSKNWGYDIGNSYGWGNSELEYYTQKPANISLDGKGKLELCPEPNRF